MILLQTSGLGYSWLAQETPKTVLYIGIGIGALIVVLIIGYLVNRNRIPREPEAQRRYSAFVFRRTARSMGLSSLHSDILLNLVQLCKVRQPFLVFTSSGLLDDVLRKGMYSIENSRSFSEDEKERRKAVLLDIKQILEANSRRGSSLKTTHFLKPGQALTLTPELGGHYPSKLVSNMQDFLCASVPTVAASAPGQRQSGAGAQRDAVAPAGTRWPRGTKLSIYFWRDADAGYSFISKVLGYDTVKGYPCVLIQHGKALRREQRRRSKRRPIMRACFFYPILIEETGFGRKTEKKAVVQTHMRSLGTVVDLSAGGCAVQALSPFEPGSLVMIEFDIDKKAPIRAFGKVKRVRKLSGRGGIMHVMFTRVTRQYLNRIRAFVYDFARSATAAPPPEKTVPKTRLQSLPRPPFPR
jgi:c-di-GMP-binding flagellar brake protein YcgR